MDRDQEKFRYLSFLGIFKEAFNITTSHKKIFTQITLSLILPLSFIYVSQNEISGFVFGQNEIISPSTNFTDDTQMESQTYANPPNIFSSEMTSFWLFKLAFFISSILLSLVSTSAVVFTVACIYSAKETTYKKVMKVVPKVLKGLLITFFWIFIISFAVIMGVSLIIFLVVFLVVITSGVPSTPGVPVMILLLVLGGIILLGILYMNLVWQLANIVSVLEDVHGIQAMKKSKNLIKGNSGLCAAVLVVLNLCFLGIDLGFKASVVGGESVWGKILHACLWAMVMSIFSLFGLVIQTIIYFVCKSYHGESIQKSSLAQHLEVFLKDYDQLDAQEEVSMV